MEKLLIPLVFFVLCHFELSSQITYTTDPSPGTASSPAGNLTGQICPIINTTYLAGTISLTCTSISGNNLSFKITKNPSQNPIFSSSGDFYWKSGGVCGDPIGSLSISGGLTSYSFNYNAQHSSGSISLYVIYRTTVNNITSNYYAGPIIITANCIDKYEENGSIASANSSVFAPLGNACYIKNISDSYIGKPSDVDFFKLNLTNGKIYLSMTNLPVNYELELQNSTTNLKSSTNSGISAESIDHYNQSGSTTWYAKIYSNPASAYSCNPYSLSLVWVPTPNQNVFNVSNINTNTLTATWAAVNGADGYQVNITSTPGSYTNTPKSTSTNSYTFTNLTPNTTYYFQVKTIYGKYEGVFSPSSQGYKTLAIASISDLQLAIPISISPTPLVKGQQGNFSTRVYNTSSNQWTGQLRWEILNSNNVLTIMNTSSVINIPANDDYLFIYSTPGGGIQSEIGNYNVRVTAKDNASTDYNTVNGNGNSNPQSISIILPAQTPNISISSPVTNWAYPKFTPLNNLASISINYSSTNVDFVNMEMVTEANVLVKDIGSNLPGSGPKNWNIPDDVPAGNYKILIYKTGTTGLPFYSGAFKIIDKPALLSPPNTQLYSSVPTTLNYQWAKINPNGLCTYEIKLRDTTAGIDILTYINTSNEDSYQHNFSYINGHVYRWVVRAKSGANNAVSESTPFVFKIDNSIPPMFNLSLASAMKFTPSTLNVGTTSNFTAIVQNTGNAPWSGSLFLKVNGVGIDLGSYTIPNGGQISYNFTPTIVHAGTDVQVELLYLTNGQLPSIRVPQGNYVNPISVTINNINSNCTTFGDIPSSDAELYGAVNCLCNLGYVTPQDYDNNGVANELNPNATIYRADLAKIVYFLLMKGNTASPADNFPVPFDDLQNSSSYFRYAKALSYLEYGDGISPFNRDQINFRPYDGISRKYAIKVILEALNIKPDFSGPNPCTDNSISVGADGYGYIKKANSLGLFGLNGAPCNADGLITRREVFIILGRILNYDGQACNRNSSLIPSTLPSSNDYFIPGIFTSRNLGRNVSYAEGYFPSYSKTSFSIPGKGLSLSFGHNYNSKLIELPHEFMPIQPLGQGWTHNYNAYIIETPAWSQGAESQPAKVYAFWPEGAIHMYDKSTLAPSTIGVYDQLTAPSASEYRIKTKNQFTYLFTRYDTDSAVGGKIWMLTQISDRNNNRIRLNYVMSGGKPRLIEAIDDVDRKLVFSYYTGSKSDKIFSVTDVAGSRTVRFGPTEAGDLQYYINALNYQTNFTYDPAITKKHLLTSITLPEGNVITNVYNTNRKLQSTQVSTAKPTLVNPIYDYSTSSPSMSSTLQDPNNDLFKQSYNQNGYMMDIEQVNTNNKISVSYGLAADLSLPTSTTYNGYRVDYSYFTNGNLKDATLDPASLAIKHQYTYTALNDLSTYIDPKNNSTSFVYSSGNLDYILDALGNKTDVTIDAQGLLKSVTSPTGITNSYTHYPNGDLKEIKDPLGHVTTMEYDGVGRIVQNTNPNLQITKMEYNPIDQVQKTTNVMSTGDIITSYVYDRNDLLREIENANFYKTYMTYTNRDLLETVQFGDDKETYTYRSDNLPQTVTKPDGTVFTMTYDGLGRLDQDGWTDYDFDDKDNVTKMEVIGSGKPLTITYDAINRIKTATYDNKTITYDYDANSNLKKLTYPGGVVVIDYEYDALNRMTNVKQSGVDLVRYYYRTDGLIDSAWMVNGTNNKYKYDGAGRMIEMNSKKSDGTIIAGYTFSLDGNGNHKVESKIEPFAPPVLASTLIKSTYNDENEILTSGTTAFEFDKNGNQTKKGNTVYTWNKVDQLIGFGSNTYSYDAKGFLRQAIRNGINTKYVWDIRGMGYMLLDTDGSGSTQNYYVYGQGLICRIKAIDNSRQYYHYDYRGSTIAITDGSQNITHQYQYDEYGNISQKTEVNGNVLCFGGKYGVMKELEELYYMRARWYQISTGRFLSEDPVWDSNLYKYSQNNPTTNIDPTGQSSFIIDNHGLFGYVKNASEVLQKVGENFDDKMWWQRMGTVIKTLDKIEIVAAIGRDIYDKNNLGVADKISSKASEVIFGFKGGVAYDLGKLAFTVGSNGSPYEDNITQINNLKYDSKLNYLNEQIKINILNLKESSNASDKIYFKGKLEKLIRTKNILNNQLINLFK